MATLKQIVAGLSNEQIDALLAEFTKAQANGGNIVGMDNMNPAGRGLLPTNAPLSSRIGRGILSGAQAAGESVVRDVREMAGFSPIAKEAPYAPIKEEKVVPPYSLQDTEAPEGYEIIGYDQKGNPMIRKIEAKSDKPTSPLLEKVKQQRTEDLITTVESNKVKKDMISQAEEAAKNINTGVYGKISRGILRGLGSKDPLLGEWQKIKMVLTDAQLMNTAKTKGAISDKEMELFSRAAANDDITSVSAMLPVFNKLNKLMAAEEKSKKDTFKKLYNEDPAEFLGETVDEPTGQGDDPLGLR